MNRNMRDFFQQLIGRPRRAAIPIMTSPGFELTGARPIQVFRDGELQFRCIAALAETFRAEALVTFMDLSVEAEAFGATLNYSEHENPTVIGGVVSDAASVQALAVPAVGTKRTAEVLKCAGLCAGAGFDRPVFGGLIGPFSLAGRLADLTELMILAASEPETAALLLEKTTEFLVEYAKAMKATGVDGLVIAEPAAGLLSPGMCREFAADYVRKIIDAVQDDRFAVILHNCGRTEKQIPALLSTGAAALHVGNAVNILDILPQVPENIPLLGNLDPVGVLKNGTPETVRAAVTGLLAATQNYPNHILSSGCDVPPQVPLDNVRAFFQALDDYNDARCDHCSRP